MYHVPGVSDNAEVRRSGRNPQISKDWAGDIPTPRSRLLGSRFGLSSKYEGDSEDIYENKGPGKKVSGSGVSNNAEVRRPGPNPQISNDWAGDILTPRSRLLGSGFDLCFKNEGDSEDSYENKRRGKGISGHLPGVSEKVSLLHLSPAALPKNRRVLLY